MTAHVHRRSVLALAAAALAPVAWSQSADSTLAEIKKRGTLRVGVTQAPPWYSKDPKSGDWSSGVGVSLGKQMAADLGVKFDPVEVTWGTAIAALQGNKIDMMSMMDATPERAEAVDFPKTALLYYSLAVLARDDLAVKAWADLDKPAVRIAVPQASSMGKASRFLLHECLKPRGRQFALHQHHRHRQGAKGLAGNPFRLLSTDPDNGPGVVPDRLFVSFRQTLPEAGPVDRIDGVVETGVPTSGREDPGRLVRPFDLHCIGGLVL